MEDHIFSEFPENLLTPEFRECVTSVCKNMEQAHESAVAAMAKLSPVMSRGPFHLLLQAMVQPVIKDAWLMNQTSKTYDSRRQVHPGHDTKSDML